MTATASGVQRTVSHDIDDQAQALPGWSQEYRQLSAGPFTGDVLHLDLPGVSLFRERTNLRIEQRTAPPPDALVVAVPLPGSSPARLNGRPVDGGTMLVLPGGGESEFLCSGPMDIVAAMLDRRALTAQGFALPALPRAQEGFTVARPGDGSGNGSSDGSGGGFAARMLEILDHGGGSPAMVAAMVADQALRTLEAALTAGAPPAPPPAAQRRRIVAKARAVLEEHGHDVPTVAQLAQAAGTSPRILEYCFAELIGLSPREYLRCVRLNRARRDLRGADPRTTTVAEVAMHWGFWHLGRFSAYYRALFGESPSETLRR